MAVYIYRQAILLRGVLWFPPLKDSLKKGRVKKEERKRKEKKKEERTKQKTTLGKKRRKKGRKSYRKTANFGREETKFASCDIPIKYEITFENGEV